MIQAFLRDSLTITNRGMVMMLKHNHPGLFQGCVLRSITTGLTWKINSRVLFGHVDTKHKRFDGENLDYLLLTKDAMRINRWSIANILDDERDGLFFYSIKPIDHDLKPDNEEILVLE